MNRVGAPEGIRHGRATVTFDEIERMRDDYEYHGMMPAAIALKYGRPLDTVRDWIYYRTRLTS